MTNLSTNSDMSYVTFSPIPGGPTGLSNPVVRWRQRSLLCRMSKLWLNNPLRADWRSYAHHFQQYAEDVIRRARQADQPDDRQGQVLNAEILRPLFGQSLESWNALCFLGQASTSPPVELTDWNRHLVGFSFDGWLQAVPDHFKGIVQRISKTPKGLWHY
jgi:hypothetical protein